MAPRTLQAEGLANPHQQCTAEAGEAAMGRREEKVLACVQYLYSGVERKKSLMQ